MIQRGSLILKTFKVVIESTAEQDLVDILSYIAYTLKEPIIAKRIYLSIREKLQSLEHMPCRHAIIDEEPYTTMEVRKILVENYIAFYFVNNSDQTVHVFRILYNRRNWRNLI